jgi:hypothetical protein
LIFTVIYLVRGSIFKNIPSHVDWNPTATIQVMLVAFLAVGSGIFVLTVMKETRRQT